MALRRQVVELVGLHLLHDVDEAGGVGEVAVVQDELLMLDVRILVEVVDAGGVEQGGAPLDAVDLVALGEQQFGQVGAVLPGDASDQRLLHTTACGESREALASPAIRYHAMMGSRVRSPFADQGYSCARGLEPK